jgi:hypothetical protein
MKEMKVQQIMLERGFNEGEWEGQGKGGWLWSMYFLYMYEGGWGRGRIIDEMNQSKEYCMHICGNVT